jgi:hypothetical protein
MIERVCTNCNKIFLVKTLRQAPMTCSQECRIQRRDQGLNSGRRNFATVIPCATCGKEMMVPPCRIGIKKTCSRKCFGIYATQSRTGKMRTSQQVKCDYCGSTTQRFASRIKNGSRQFCDNKCYHAWDSDYKRTPEMITVLTERAIKTLARKTSKVEDTVAAWLESQGVEHERQVRLRYWVIDFKCGDVYVEVNGCYWHGCIACHGEFNASQRDRQARDKGKQTYCKDRGIHLLTIWEHDIRRHNFTALSVLLQ